MFAGIDFGTSNCLIGVWENNKAKLIPLNGDEYELGSTVFITQSEDAATGQTLRNQSIVDVLRHGNSCVFGEKALESFIEDPEAGHLVKSPKSFLGSKLQQAQLDVFESIAAKMFAHIKHTAEQHLDAVIGQVVVGRPVHFHGTQGAVGDKQAETILRNAAQKAGFEQVEFMLEPIAAALDFEQKTAKDMLALVLDIGGGTTDCSMIKIGPSYQHHRNDSLLGHYAGIRSGGMDLDIQLAFNHITPLMGRGKTEVPDQMYWDAVKINDFPAQARFLSSACGNKIDHYLSLAPAAMKTKIARLKTLQNHNQTLRLGRSAELAKIHLSGHGECNLPLDYLELELTANLLREDFERSIQRNLDSFVRLVHEVEKQAGAKPDVVYVTGGTAKSPIIQQHLNASLAGNSIVYGDLFGSVASGLTAWASHLYR